MVATTTMTGITITDSYYYYPNQLHYRRTVIIKNGHNNFVIMVAVKICVRSGLRTTYVFNAPYCRTTFVAKWVFPRSNKQTTPSDHKNITL